MHKPRPTFREYNQIKDFVQPNRTFHCKFCHKEIRLISAHKKFFSVLHLVLYGVLILGIPYALTAIQSWEIAGENRWLTYVLFLAAWLIFWAIMIGVDYLIFRFRRFEYTE